MNHVKSFAVVLVLAGCLLRFGQAKGKDTGHIPKKDKENIYTRGTDDEEISTPSSMVSTRIPTKAATTYDSMSSSAILDDITNKGPTTKPTTRATTTYDSMSSSAILSSEMSRPTQSSQGPNNEPTRASPTRTTARKKEKGHNPYVTAVFALTGFIFFVAFVVFTRAYCKCKPTHGEEDEPAEQHTSRPRTGVTDADNGKPRGEKATTDMREGCDADRDGSPSRGGVVYAELCHNEQPKAKKKCERTNMVIPPRYEPVTYAHIDNLRQELEMKKIGHPSHHTET